MDQDVEQTAQINIFRWNKCCEFGTHFKNKILIFSLLKPPNNTLKYFLIKTFSLHNMFYNHLLLINLPRRYFKVDSLCLRFVMAMTMAAL